MSVLDVVVVVVVVKMMMGGCGWCFVIQISFLFKDRVVRE